MFSYGSKFKISIYGTSHEDTMGLLIEGLKPGTSIDLDKIKEDLNLRRPAKIGTTNRIEADNFEIVNGYFNNYTTGAPLHIVIKNNDTKSKDYENLKYHFRPNHADYTANIKYNGYQDYRGGGFFSGRLTSLLVIAGSIAKSILPYKIESKISKIGTLTKLDETDSYLNEIIEEKDSVGGIINIKVSNMIPGLGDPYFNKLDAAISHMMLTIPGVKGIVFGDSFSIENKGSINNDVIINNEGKTKTNYSGGIVGGISNGNDIVFNTYIKPTSSIGKTQETFNFNTNKIEELKITGRHDTAFIRRMPIVLENALAIVLANY